METSRRPSTSSASEFTVDRCWPSLAAQVRHTHTAYDVVTSLDDWLLLLSCCQAWPWTSSQHHCSHGQSNPQFQTAVIKKKIETVSILLWSPGKRGKKTYVLCLKSGRERAGLHQDDRNILDGFYCCLSFCLCLWFNSIIVSSQVVVKHLCWT